MWVEISKDSFQKAEFKSLNYLFQILTWSPNGMQPRYNIFVDTAELKCLSNFKLLSTIENSLLEFLDTEFNNFVISSSSNSAVNYKISYKKSRLNFNVGEAIHFFNQPVSIVLENNKNDSEFIISLIDNFADEQNCAKAKNHIVNNWLKFENAGGCSNMPNFLEIFLKQFTDIAEKNNRTLAEYFRGLILIDSDREYDNQPSKHDRLLEKLIQLGLCSDKIHILKKRMMENYMPDAVFLDMKSQLSKNSDICEWIAAYMNLTETQKNFINIPDGFPPKNDKYDKEGKRKPISGEILNFFNLKIDDINFKKLDIGLKFKGYNNDGDLKNEFPKLYKKRVVNYNTLNARDKEDELKEIVEKIIDLI